MDDGAAQYIQRIEELNSNDEQALLELIVTRGYDQGCFLRLEADEFLPADDPEVTHAVFVSLNGRAAVQANVSDPFELEQTPTGTIEREQPGYVILTQRCDLVRPLVTEPFIELAYAELIHDAAAINEAKKLSNRKLHIADREQGGAWVADLRCRVAFPKDRLIRHPMVQPIDGERMRKRFKLRVAQRYSRDPLPDDVRERLQPLISLLRKNKTSMTLSEPFSDFLVFRQDDKVLVLAIYPPRVETKAADDAWQSIEDELGEEFVDEHLHPDSSAISMQDLSFALYIDGWLLDLGDISVASKASDAHEMPSG